jgi:putative membrane protein
MYPMMYGYDYGFYSPFHFLGGLFSVLIWIIVVVALFKLVRGRHGHLRDMWDRTSAMSVLRERYARGEISKEEYEERKKVLEQK